MINHIYIDFIGDSMIERWDLYDYFDTWIARNYGKSGAGIEYVEMLYGKFNKGQIVVMIGSNDNEFFDVTMREEYACRYIQAIKSLGANKVYLFSVLPCVFSRNGDIEAFNDLIKNKIKSYSDIEYIDVYAKFIDQGAIKKQLYCDGLHLSPLGYQILTDELKVIVTNKTQN